MKEMEAGNENTIIDDTVNTKKKDLLYFHYSN